MQFPKITQPKIQATCSQIVASIRRAERAFAEVGEKGRTMQTTSILHIIPFLSGQAFQPETIEAMGIAYENVCKSLKLVDRSGLLNELIAAISSSLRHAASVIQSAYARAYWLPSNQRRMSSKAEYTAKRERP